ncbi:hypothetical protein SAMN05661044_04155 [Olivibacter domesticus]|uniref:Uncharacterized protein n=1 Tax=Olivibacter domesticus TaxID=407022 RepID=A0A1H7VG25_OLID1|nr:hypothetical protein SAMN05661044_04155 [Olivibacter domesticus]
MLGLVGLKFSVLRVGMTDRNFKIKSSMTLIDPFGNTVLFNEKI